jgi:L-aspartate oxidase
MYQFAMEWRVGWRWLGMPDFNSRRYLCNYDYRRLPHLVTDILVIGTGVGGLRAAIEAARYGHVLVLSKTDPKDSGTAMAQGGVAAALGADDDAESHMADTMLVGCGLCDGRAVRKMVQEGPGCIRELIDWGAEFDRDDGHFLLGLEGGHSRSRILHSHGDATGAEIARALLARTASTPDILVFDNCYVVDLLTTEAGCVGAVTWSPRFGLQMFWARQTILATGGVGRLYRESTNLPQATGDGYALAFRAGATLRAMEMVQFHPTTLYVAGATRALISEAVRGEGAYLTDRNGARFMPQYHPQAELAPRDVVSRAILRQMVKTSGTHVFLDVRHIGSDRFHKRFPYISKLCEQFGVDVGKDLIPVRPAEHYMIGGVAVDLSGRTDVKNLYAVGEAANTGAHGANRLASNSLLEGLVFGREAGRAAGAALASIPNSAKPSVLTHAAPRSQRRELDLPDVANALRSLMWRNVGIERNGEQLTDAVDVLKFWGRYVLDKSLETPAEWEVQNMLTTGMLIARSALARDESRGVHFRTDYPHSEDRRWRRNTLVRRGESELKLETEPMDESTGG